MAHLMCGATAGSSLWWHGVAASLGAAAAAAAVAAVAAAAAFLPVLAVLLARPVQHAVAARPCSEEWKPSQAQPLAMTGNHSVP
eukprot:1230345-Alexandrium_andersonii.AAC.1